MADDVSRFGIIRERLFTSVIGDVMDTQGLRQQFLPPAIRALMPGTVMVGHAMTVAEADVEEGGDGDFGLMFRALDDLKTDEVYVCTGASPRYALWGELMSTRARTLGAAGAVVDGFHRDTNGILAVGLPVFSAGSYAQIVGLVVPKEHLDEIIRLALAKVDGEETVRRMIEKGEGTQAIFDRTGIM